MAQSTAVRNKRDGQILISDSGAAHTETVAYEAGDLAWTIPGVSVSHYLDRGELGSTPSLRNVDDQPMTLSFSVYFRDPGDTANAYSTLTDIAVRFASRYVETAWVSTLGTASDTFTVTIAWTVDGTFAGEADKTLSFPYCVFRVNMKEGDPNTLECTATSFALKPTLA